MKSIKRFFAISFTISFALSLFACGNTDETIIETHTSTGYDLIPDGSFVSDYDCDDSHLGRLLYSETFKSVYLCDGEVWQIINGKNGTNGRDGKAGVDGKDGKDGSDGKDGNVCSVVDNIDRLEFNCNGDTSSIVFNWKIDDGCSIVSATDSLITIVCDSLKVEVPNALDGKHGTDCSLEDNGDGTFKQVCGDSVFEFSSTISRAAQNVIPPLCGRNTYDAEKDTCINDVLYSHCADTLFVKNDGYCNDGDVYTFCGNLYTYYNVRTQVCVDGAVRSYCGEDTYDAAKAFCRDGKVVGEN